MGLSAAFLDAHVTSWERHLTGFTYPHRSKWPSRLFHHAPIENVVKILESGTLLSRVDSDGLRPKDVAGAEIISARDQAHQFARLYFRPRTPTQYHIEGIRKLGECQFGDAAHAPVLTMLVFDARRVLSMESVRFSDANMQWSEARDDCTEDFFKNIPFDKVYHEGSHSDPSITKHRCAEVLVPSPMPLGDSIQWVYCRSHAERSTLLHLLGAEANLWEKKVIVSDDLKVFEKRFVYVEHVSLASDGIVFQLASRRDSACVNIGMDVWNAAHERIVEFKDTDFSPRPEGSEAWKFPRELSDGKYLVRIELEGHFAFQDMLTLGETPF